jgi:hypothetical protein
MGGLLLWGTAIFGDAERDVKAAKAERIKDEG